MDNIFQIIIFIFVIWSIIGSTFGKKKQQNKQSLPRKLPRGETSRPTPTYSQTPQDMLEDILGFKIPKTEDEYPANINYEAEDLEMSSKNLEQDSEEIDARSKYEKALEEIDYDKLGSLEQTPLELPKSEKPDTYSIKPISHSHSTHIKMQFKNKKSIRDAFVISEIIGKPKSLRNKIKN